MFNKRLEPLSALGMIITQTQAIAIASIACVTDLETGYEVELTNGTVLTLIGEDAVEFDSQLGHISKSIRSSQFAAQSGVIKVAH